MTDISKKEIDVLASLRGMSKVIGLRQDFLTELISGEQTDWTFVIKTHALLESVVCQLLAAHLQRPEIEDVLAERVQMEDRIEILKALKLVDASERKMMRRLGKIRNGLVHNVQQTDFAFSAHFTSKDLRREFVESFATSWPDPISGDPPLSRAEYIVQNPRLAIWMSVLGIVSKTLDAKGLALFEAERKAHLDRLEQAIKGLTGLAGEALESATGTGSGDRSAHASGHANTKREVS